MKTNIWELAWHIQDMQKSIDWTEKELAALSKIGMSATNRTVEDLTDQLTFLKLRIALAKKAKQDFH